MLGALGKGDGKERGWRGGVTIREGRHGGGKECYTWQKQSLLYLGNCPYKAGAFLGTVVLLILDDGRCHLQANNSVDTLVIRHNHDTGKVIFNRHVISLSEPLLLKCACLHRQVGIL